MSDLFGEEEEAASGPPRLERLPEMPRLPERNRAAGEEVGLDVRPLAERLRPGTLAEYLGQEDLLGADGPLRRLIASDRLPSMMLWGPPGSGKTTLARLIANEVRADFVTLSAVTAALRDVRAVIDVAKTNVKFQRRTILFIDEIHRFNKAQQDAFLPHVESGIITLIGATTENPSFSIISPLLSRSRVFVLKPMLEPDLVQLLRRGLERLNREKPPAVATLHVEEDALVAICRLCDGDARRALGLLETASSVRLSRVDVGSPDATITAGDIASLAQRHFIYDRQGEEHYNLISALHKTVRSSDPHGALYWMGRMLAAGEDPLYIARRLVRMAVEDIGLADPQALPQAMEALRAYQMLGSPEGELALAQTAVYLAMAPKSNAVYMGYKEIRSAIEDTGSLPVPMHLRNAPTGLMKQLDYGKDYTYDHDAEGAFAAKQGLPDALAGRRFYQPTARGWEGRRREALEEQDRARDSNRGKS